MPLFFDRFFAHKWTFFYQLVLAIFKKHESDIKTEEDIYNLLRSIKTAQREEYPSASEQMSSYMDDTKTKVVESYDTTTADQRAQTGEDNSDSSSQEDPNILS